MKLRVGLATLLGLLLFAGQVNAHTLGLVGTYHMVSHTTTGTYASTIDISTFDPSTGKITGVGTISASTGGAYTLSLSGTVIGSALVMQIVEPATGYSEYDRGTIATDGSISGTLTNSLGATGTWTMTPATSTSPATQTGKPVVRPSGLKTVVGIDSGFDRDPSGGAGQVIDYGVVLLNNSLRFDAVNVTATVRALDTNGRSFATDETPVTVIPAGRTLVIAGLLTPSVSLGFSKLRVTVKVAQWRPKRIQLPIAKSVHFDSYDCCQVTGSFTNPYRTAISQDAPIYAIFLDAQGHIIGGAADTTGASVRGRATVDFDVTGLPLNDPNASPASARVSVDPCSDFDVLAGTCVALRRP